ncbi:MAG: ethanolamine-phosphate phospho-lyase [Arcticibacterium sp.]|jgi:ethanolamine-phosphate phospho-lyase
MDKILLEEFGFNEVELQKLDGYESANYIVKADSKKYIFKTYSHSEETIDLINAENEVLLYLKLSNTVSFPCPIAFLDGSFVKVIKVKGQTLVCRMLSHLDGTFLGSVNHTKELFESFGNSLAEIDLALKNFNNYTIAAIQKEWDIQHLHLSKKYIDYINNTKDRSLVQYFFLQYEENVIPTLPFLRKQVIHNDANEWNVLTKNEHVSGIIDFGDFTYSFLINELAIAITYGCYDKEEPLEWASIIIKAYHERLPLHEKELNVLYYLIAGRLIISVCQSAHSRKINPENAYATGSEKTAWKMLYKWLEINPIAADNSFRDAVGFPKTKQISIDKIIKKRHLHISPILSLSYDEPIQMAKSAFQYMYDAAGNTFLDAYNNIPHVGHSHPTVVATGQRQMAKLNTNTRYLYDELSAYAEKLLAKFPKSLNKVYFVNSGSAASDLAIRIAKIHTQKEKILVMEHGYHGHTQMATDISDYKFNHPKGQGQKEFIIKTEIPATYRGRYSDIDAGKKYAQDTINKIKKSKVGIAAFICEPIVGCGGQVPLAKGYLRELYPAIRAQGGVCISDEVQTGFGRLGDFFWGYQAQEVIPDMVIIGKPMANGHPMGAVICTSEIADSFSRGVEFFSSFGGNTVSCAIGLSVLDVIEEENLQEHSKNVGDYYKSLFLDLQKKYDHIGDVRGSGLFLGVEIVKPSDQKPDTKLAHYIKNELRNNFILISTDGPFDNVLKTKPPLCFTTKNAETVVKAIEQALRNYIS